MTLYELTNHEAGIIVYDAEAKVVGVFNWGGCDDDQIPCVGPVGLVINWPEENGVFDDVKAERFPDVRAMLPGSVWMTEETDERGARICDTDMDIVEDGNGDLARLFLDETLEAYDYEGIAYTLKDGRMILALDMWN